MSSEEILPLLFSWCAPIGADWPAQWVALNARIRALEDSATHEECDEICLALRRVAARALSYREHLQLQSLARRVVQRAPQFPLFRQLRIGIVGNRTLSYLCAALPAAGMARGLLIEAIEIPYEAVVAAAHGGSGGIPSMTLDAVVVVLDVDAFAVGEVFQNRDLETQALRQAGTFLERLVGRLSAAMNSPVIVATIPAPDANVSSSDLALPGSPLRLAALINGLMADGAGCRAWLMWDLAALATSVGTRLWFDAVRFHEAKTPFRIELAPLVADHLCRTLAAMSGKGCRALVLDLDNTLWGGEIGDDGVAGIRLGQNSAEGEAFVAFQRFLLDLRRRGVVLAVCSKNTDAVAKEPFRLHPEMLLKEEHIAVFQANWEDKAANIESIARALKLNLESLAFVDDSAAERERIRQALPLVSVPEMGSEPALFADRIAAAGVFDHLLLTAEDQFRAESYRSRAQATELAAVAGSYDEYLRSLEMNLSVSRFDAIGRARIAQLINKSNQFNLTTRRYRETDIQRFEADDTILCWQARLDDTFGAHGIIAVVIVHKQRTSWSIDTWLMSCRALTRGIEAALMNTLMAEAHNAGVESVIGEFIPTVRNALVADFFPRMGFTAMDCPAGPTKRYCTHPAEFRPLDHCVHVKLLAS